MIKKKSVYLILSFCLLCHFSISLASGAYVNFIRTPEVSSRYQLGQSVFSRYKCSSCHRGNLALTRSRLLRVRNNLSGLISNCSHHAKFCNQLSSSDKEALIYYLRVRYRL